MQQPNLLSEDNNMSWSTSCLLLCMSVLLGGGSISKVRQIFLHMVLGCVSLNTYFRYQKVCIHRMTVHLVDKYSKLAECWTILPLISTINIFWWDILYVCRRNLKLGTVFEFRLFSICYFEHVTVYRTKQFHGQEL